MLLISSKKSVDTYKNHIEQFKEIYLQSFIDLQEREDFYEIISRVKFDEFPKTVLILKCEKDKVLGGMIVDIYDNVIFHLIYIATDPKYRGRGCAKELVHVGLPKLIRNFKSSAKGVFVETNIPELTKLDSFSPNIRCKIFEGFGMKRIPIKYIQPPLDWSKDWVFNLQLLFYPIDGSEQISTNEVTYFLNSLYLSLEQPLEQENLQFMRKTLESFGDTIKFEPILN